jgi:hypothetical protein
MSAVTCGKFSYENGALSGPAKYMKERGNNRLDDIVSGNDAAFNAMAATGMQSDPIMLVMVAMQTDYAGWVGMEQFCNAHGIGGAV